ncbi:hypothetical protein LguiA_023245 [Lonicera macranthoides]
MYGVAPWQVLVAEARFRPLDFAQALQDCEEALKIESTHFKTTRNVVSSIQGISARETDEIWNKLYPAEPYEFDSTSAFSHTLSNDEVIGAAKCTDYDLIKAIERQSPFFYQVEIILILAPGTALIDGSGDCFFIFVFLFSLSEYLSELAALLVGFFSSLEMEDCLNLEDDAGVVSNLENQCLAGKFKIANWGENMFTVTFEHKEDVDKVLAGSPWSVMGYTTVLVKWDVKIPVSEVSFDYCNFWLQILNLPVGKRSEANVRKIAELAGRVVDIEPLTPETVMNCHYVRVKILVDVRKPLKRGFKLLREGDQYIWISFQYERLSNFCYLCGSLGHEKEGCRELASSIDSSEKEWNSKLTGEDEASGHNRDKEIGEIPRLIQLAMQGNQSSGIEIMHSKGAEAGTSFSDEERENGTRGSTNLASQKVLNEVISHAPLVRKSLCFNNQDNLGLEPSIVSPCFSKSQEKPIGLCPISPIYYVKEPSEGDSPYSNEENNGVDRIQVNLGSPVDPSFLLHRDPNPWNRDLSLALKFKDLSIKKWKRTVEERDRYERKVRRLSINRETNTEDRFSNVVLPSIGKSNIQVGGFLKGNESKTGGKCRK